MKMKINKSTIFDSDIERIRLLLYLKLFGPQ